MLECLRIILRILKGSFGPGVADAAAGRVQVDASQEGGEFGGGHLDAIGGGGRNSEGPALESFEARITLPSYLGRYKNAWSPLGAGWRWMVALYYRAGRRFGMMRFG